MTSWTKRINNCVGVIQSILCNTVKPDIVFLNLSEQEFPQKEHMLPNDLIRLIKSNPRVKLNWVSGPNTKSMKKVFPILQYLNDDDLIIDIDDDIVVPNDLIEVRVNEFHQHGCKSPISGGSNPKYHLNKPLIRGITYNVMTSTSIMQKKMLNGYEKYLTKDVIETYNDDTIYTLIMLCNGYHVLPSRILSTGSGTTKRTIGFKNSICPLGGGFGVNKGYKSDENTIKAFIKAFNDVNIVKFDKQFMNLVIFDSDLLAGDNGEYLYRQVRDKYPCIKLTFLLSNKSKDWDRLKRDGFNLYPFEGTNLDMICKNATYILWSKDIKEINILRKYRDKSVFLDHGILSDIYDCGKYIRDMSNYAKYICCSASNEINLVNKYSSNKFIPIKSGLPRHDILLSKWNEYKNNTQRPKQIFITFHWRLAYNSNIQLFKNSQYLKDINNILQSEQLRKLNDGGVKVVFYPHAMFRKYLPLFNIPSYVEVPNNKTFQDILVESDCIVSDFSSNTFEMAYMNKPTFGFVPGANQVGSSMHYYHIENLKNKKQITYCQTMDVLFDNLKKFVESNEQYDFAKDIFFNIDKNNTNRLIQFLFELKDNETSVISRQPIKPNIIRCNLTSRFETKKDNFNRTSPKIKRRFWFG